LFLKTFVIGRYGKLFICLPLIESVWVKMSEKYQLKGDIYEVKFRYHSKMGGIYDTGVGYTGVIGNA